MIFSENRYPLFRIMLYRPNDGNRLGCRCGGGCSCGGGWNCGCGGGRGACFGGARFCAGGGAGFGGSGCALTTVVSGTLQSVSQMS
jgi:hypothetical protein